MKNIDDVTEEDVKELTKKLKYLNEL